MNYANKTFSVTMGGKNFAEGYDKIDWGKKETKKDTATCCHWCSSTTPLQFRSERFPTCSRMGDCECHE